MKKIIAVTILIFTVISVSGHGGSNYEHSDFFKEMKEGDKAAILMVHFGTTHSDTRTKTIDKLNAKAKEQFPEVEVREA